jgi:monoamine oxidase
LVSGNDGIASGLRDAVSDRIRYGKRLTRVRKKSDGRIELTFADGSSNTATHDAVVLTLPFIVLRGVDLDASLGLPPWKIDAIDKLGYGTNAKTMLGFDSPYWVDLGCNGARYSDLPNHQTTWETNPDLATASHVILTDYSSGLRGASLNPRNVQREAGRFIADLETVLPGASAQATRIGADYLAHRSTGRPTRSPSGAIPATCRDSSPPSPATRGSRLPTCSSRASRPTPSTSGRASGRGPRCRASTRPRPS